ncbi:MAG: cell division protein ZapA [Candidatus Sumerlaeaceae bacterium]
MSQESNNHGGPAKLEFEIYNLPFRLRAPEDEHERLRRAARHVDTLMRDLSSKLTTPDTGKLAMQAALLVTVEYYKMIDDASAVHGLTDDVRKRVDGLIDMLDEQLNVL